MIKGDPTFYEVDEDLGYINKHYFFKDFLNRTDATIIKVLNQLDGG
jgi:hypothetical protein